MFLTLYRGTQYYSWYDITMSMYDEDADTCGEETTVFYQYALFPGSLRRDDGGQSSRKDGFSIDTDVEAVDHLPADAELRAPDTLGTLFSEIRLWLYYYAYWARFIHHPVRFWLPTRMLGSFWMRPECLDVVRDYYDYLRRSLRSLGATHLGMWLRTIAYQLNCAFHLRNTCSFTDDGECVMNGDFSVYGWDFHLVALECPLWPAFLFLKPVRSDY